MSKFPELRMRRLRRHAWIRDLVAEHRLSPRDLIWPVFVREGQGIEEPVASMPGVVRYSVDTLVPAVARAADLGVKAVAIFPVIDPAKKDEVGSEARNPDNLTCRATRALKEKVDNIGLICDVALDPYTSHGQDGLLKEGQILNDPTLEALAEQACVQADAGADIIAPSDMMDGRIGAVRKALDGRRHADTLILSYAAKYASSFYGPFRDALGSASALGSADKRTYQMNPANGDAALREVALDIEEGADMVMVKPGLPYLDVAFRIKARFTLPTFAYQVSGEYAMLRSAADAGRLDWQHTVLESLLCFRRAGVDGILTYAACEAASWLQEQGGCL